MATLAYDNTLIHVNTHALFLSFSPLSFSPASHTDASLSPCVLQISELTDEQKEYLAKLEAEKAEKAGGEGGSVEAKGPTSIWHGKEKTDYQGERREGRGREV